MAIKQISSQLKIKIEEYIWWLEVGVLYGIKISIDIKCNLLEQFSSKYDQFKTIQHFLFFYLSYDSPYYYFTSNYCVRKNNKLSHIVIHSSIILPTDTRWMWCPSFFIFFIPFCCAILCNCRAQHTKKISQEKKKHEKWAKNVL